MEGAGGGGGERSAREEWYKDHSRRGDCAGKK
jgi:hypothetical protein